MAHSDSYSVKPEWQFKARTNANTVAFVSTSPHFRIFVMWTGGDQVNIYPLVSFPCPL